MDAMIIIQLPLLIRCESLTIMSQTVIIRKGDEGPNDILMGGKGAVSSNHRFFVAFYKAHLPAYHAARGRGKVDMSQKQALRDSFINKWKEESGGRFLTACTYEGKLAWYVTPQPQVHEWMKVTISKFKSRRKEQYKFFLEHSRTNDVEFDPETGVDGVSRILLDDTDDKVNTRKRKREREPAGKSYMHVIPGLSL